MRRVRKLGKVEVPAMENRVAGWAFLVPLALATLALMLIGPNGDAPGQSELLFGAAILFSEYCAAYYAVNRSRYEVSFTAIVVTLALVLYPGMWIATAAVIPLFAAKLVRGTRGAWRVVAHVVMNSFGLAVGVWTALQVADLLHPDEMAPSDGLHGFADRAIAAAVGGLVHMTLPWVVSLLLVAIMRTTPGGVTWRGMIRAAWPWAVTREPMNVAAGIGLGWVFLVDPMAALLIGCLAAAWVVLLVQTLAKRSTEASLFASVVAGYQQLRTESVHDTAQALTLGLRDAIPYASSIEMVVMVDRPELYGLRDDGVVQLLDSGLRVLELPGVRMLSEDPSPQVLRTVDHGLKVFFTLQGDTGRRIMVRVETPNISTSTRRHLMRTVKTMVREAPMWVPVLHPDSDELLERLRGSSSHLVTLVSQPGELPVRALLDELRRLEELVAARLADRSVAPGAAEVSELPDLVPTGTWAGAHDRA